MRKAVIIAAAATVLLMMAHNAYSQIGPYIPSIGMSSSFDSFSPLQIPRGGWVFSDSLFVVIFNHANSTETVALNYTAPPGISITFHPPEHVFDIAPHTYRRIVLEVRVSKDIVPGPYEVIVTAYEIKRPEPGKVVVIPAVSHKLRIIVEGEYGYIRARAVDPAGALVHDALVRLYRVINGTEVNIIDSRNGTLNARVVPGEYVIRAYLMGDLVAEKRFSLEAFEDKNITLVLRIIYFERFSIIPVVSNETGNILSARLHAVLKNVYRTLNNTAILLIVRKDGEPLENRTLVSAGVLPVGRTTYDFDYVPYTGWSRGNYTFRLVVYGLGNRVLATSDLKWIYVSGEAGAWYSQPLGVLAIVGSAAAVMAGLLYLRRGAVLEIIDAWVDPYTRTAKVIVRNRGGKKVVITAAEVSIGSERVRRSISLEIPPGSRARVTLALGDDVVELLKRFGKGTVKIYGNKPLLRTSSRINIREG